jgi:hypothetical protein
MTLLINILPNIKPFSRKQRFLMMKLGPYRSLRKGSDEESLPISSGKTPDQKELITGKNMPDEKLGI